MWKCLSILSYNFLDANITLEDQQVEHGGLQDALGGFGAA